MNTKETLLDACYANPDDDTPRLMYADFLDEDHAENPKYVVCPRCKGSGTIEMVTKSEENVTTKTVIVCTMCEGKMEILDHSRAHQAELIRLQIEKDKLPQVVELTRVFSQTELRRTKSGGYDLLQEQIRLLKKNGKDPVQLNDPVSNTIRIVWEDENPQIKRLSTQIDAILRQHKEWWVLCPVCEGTRTSPVPPHTVFTFLYQPCYLCGRTSDQTRSNDSLRHFISFRKGLPDTMNVGDWTSLFDGAPIKSRLRLRKPVKKLLSDHRIVNVNLKVLIPQCISYPHSTPQTVFMFNFYDAEQEVYPRPILLGQLPLFMRDELLSLDSSVFGTIKRTETLLTPTGIFTAQIPMWPTSDQAKAAAARAVGNVVNRLLKENR